MLSRTINLSWLFCKVVPYDEIRSVVEKAHPDQSAMTATQMWNGMQYANSLIQILNLILT